MIKYLVLQFGELLVQMYQKKNDSGKYHCNDRQNHIHFSHAAHEIGLILCQHPRQRNNANEECGDCFECYTFHVFLD